MITTTDSDVLDKIVATAKKLQPGETHLLYGLTNEQVRKAKHRVKYHNTQGTFDTRFRQYDVRLKRWLDGETYTVQLEKVEVDA